MEKETKVTAPEGCEIEKVEIVDDVAVITFKKKERKLPKSWKEFCEMFPIKDSECYINSTGKIEEYLYHRDITRDVKNKNHLPDRATAEAVLALCQLIQLRECFNQGWKPDWNESNYKYLIVFREEEIMTASLFGSADSPLYFKTEELRDLFLEYFHPLIEKLKPLYGIKEGGEE